MPRFLAVVAVGVLSYMQGYHNGGVNEQTKNSQSQARVESVVRWVNSSLQSRLIDTSLRIKSDEAYRALVLARTDVDGELRLLYDNIGGILRGNVDSFELNLNCKK